MIYSDQAWSMLVDGRVGTASAMHDAVMPPATRVKLTYVQEHSDA